MSYLTRLYYTIFRREDKTFGSVRSPKWRSVRKKYLKGHPECAVCGGTKKNEIHHIQPFYKRPDLELNLFNLINLCETKKDGVRCHQFFGHLGNYRSANPNVVEDAKIWAIKLKTR